MTRLYAVVDPASPRYEGWVRDLGCDFIPVRSSEAEAARFDGRPGPVPVYLVDLEALTPGLLRKVVERTAREFGATVEEVLAQLDAMGLPVLAEGVIVCEDPDRGRLRFPFWSGRGGDPAWLAISLLIAIAFSLSIALAKGVGP